MYDSRSGDVQWPARSPDFSACFLPIGMSQEHDMCQPPQEYCRTGVGYQMKDWSRRLSVHKEELIFLLTTKCSMWILESLYKIHWAVRNFVKKKNKSSEYYFCLNCFYFKTVRCFCHTPCLSVPKAPTNRRSLSYQPPSCHTSWTSYKNSTFYLQVCLL